MAYGSNSYNFSWQPRDLSFPVENYYQNDKAYGGYARGDNYSMNQMERMAYTTIYSYGNQRSRINQLSSDMRPIHGKRFPRGSASNKPPSKKNLTHGKRYFKPVPAHKPPSKKKLAHRKRFNKASPANEPRLAEKPTDGKSLAQSNTTAEPPSKESKVGEDKPNRRNNRRKRFFRKKKNVRKLPKEDATRLSSHMRPIHGKRFPRGNSSNGAPSKKNLTHGKRSSNAGSANEPPSKKKPVHRKKFNKACPTNEPPSAGKSTHGKRPTQNNSTVEPPSKKSKVDEDKRNRRNNRRKRSFRKRKNVRKLPKEEATSSFQDEKIVKCFHCSVGFNSTEAYIEHLKSELHKVKFAEFYYCQKLPLGFDDEEDDLESAEVEENQRKEDENTIKDESNEVAMETDEVKKENECDNKIGEEKKKDEKPNPWGVSFLVRVNGFYCKLCRKFFKSKSVAKEKHCSSRMHCETYKKVIEIALKDQEDRQRREEAHSESQDTEKLAVDSTAALTEIGATATSEDIAAHSESDLPSEIKDEGPRVPTTNNQGKPTDITETTNHEVCLLLKMEQAEVVQEVKDKNIVPEETQKAGVVQEVKDNNSFPEETQQAEV